MNSGPATQPTPPLIRIGTLSDAPLLTELGSRSFKEAFAADNTPEDMADYLAQAFTPTKQGQELADPTSLFLIAELDQQPVGYAKLRPNPAHPTVLGSRPIELERLYLLQAWLGFGVGSALMHTGLREAEQRGYETLWLGVWEHNTRAQAFYHKWGFERVGSQFFQLGGDRQTDWVMQRPILLKKF